MKKFLLVLIVFFICFTFLSCTNNGDLPNNNTYNFETDVQYYYRNSSGALPVTAAPDGYYAVGEKGIVLFIDKNTMKATPLCNRPNCLHNDPDKCNAFLVDYSNVGLAIGAESTETIIQYNNGRIYLIGTEYDKASDKTGEVLLSYKPDGTDRKNITGFLDYEGGYRTDWFIHRGYFYYVSDHAIFRISMKSPEKNREKIYELKNYQKNYSNVYINSVFGDYIFFDTMKISKEGVVEGREGLSFNTKTLEMKQVNINGKIARVKGFMNGKVISYVMADNNEWKYYISDLSFENNELLSDEEVSYQLSADDNYIYGDNIYTDDCLDGKIAQEIKVFDSKMNKIDSFIFPSKVPYDNLSAQDERCFFVILPDKKDNYYLYYIDKNKIGSWNGDKSELNKIVKLKWASQKLSDDIIVAD